MTADEKINEVMELVEDWFSEDETYPEYVSVRSVRSALVAIQSKLRQLIKDDEK